MRPKWNNLFWYERGGNSGKSQLENNTTKGLLKVLQESDYLITEEFLGAVFDDDPELGEASLTYDTQVTLNEIARADRTLHLVGLSYRGNNLARDAPPRTGDGRVDGLITIDGEQVAPDSLG